MKIHNSYVLSIYLIYDAIVTGESVNKAAIIRWSILPEADEAEEVDDEEEDDDDYGQLSAAQLLMRHMAGGDEDGFGEEEDYY